MENCRLAGEGTLLFTPISEEVITKITGDSLCLESGFWLNGNRSQEVQLVLTNHYLAICEKGFFSNIFHYYTPLLFDLKFEPLYAPLPDNSIASKKIGFRLHRAACAPVDFQIVADNVIDIWMKCLTRSLNQLGFHKLYKPIKKIGKGGFATVYEVERLTDKLHFAVKAFSKQNTLNSDNPSQRLNLLNEIQMMRSFENPNIIKLEAVFESDNSLYLVLELLTAGQLHTRINKRAGNFTMTEIRQFITGMAKGLHDMHERRIMHRDIKPENIMLRSEDSLEPVIVDFGLAAHADSNDYIFYRCGTPGYVAPEITTLEKGMKVEPVCDVFSLGVIFHILLTRKPLFEGRKFE